MADDSPQLVWVVLRLNLIGDEGNGSLSHVEIHSTEASAKAAADALLHKNSPKTTKKAPKVEIVEDSVGRYDSIQSWTWTVSDQQDKFRVQLLKKDLKAEESLASSSKESKTKGKRKAKNAPKDSKSGKAAEDDNADPELDDEEAPPKKVPMRQRPGVISDGKPDCLADLKLLFTGTFDSMDRKGCTDTAEMYGASIVSKLKDADYVVLGTKPGPKKLEEIEKLGLTTFNEQEFLNILKTGKMP